MADASDLMFCEQGGVKDSMLEMWCITLQLLRTSSHNSPLNALV
jgi:hypothetical protein